MLFFHVAGRHTRHSGFGGSGAGVPQDTGKAWHFTLPLPFRRLQELRDRNFRALDVLLRPHSAGLGTAAAHCTLLRDRT